MSKKLIKIAHSPDSDDAFMFYALKKGLITSDKYDFQIDRRDIEELNKLAQKEEYDITAISIHAYAHLCDKYALTASGCSMAEKDYGPMVISKRDLEPNELAGKTIAVPGEWTTAFLVLKLIEPNIKHKALPFDQIMSAVEHDLVDAGLIIHEGQLQYKEQGFKKVLHIIDYWKSVAGELPLPLGGSAVKRSLGKELMEELAELQRQSIEYAIDHPEDARNYALQFKRDLTPEQADHYLSWYANDRTLNLGKDGLLAITLLFKLAYEKNLINKHIPIDIIGY